jgi:hypothetical protein
MAQTKGERWAAGVRDAYDLNEAQEVTVDIAARCMDAIASLPPADHQEIRAQETILLRALSQLALPDSEGAAVVSLSASQKGRKAARARWDQTKDRA